MTRKAYMVALLSSIVVWAGLIFVVRHSYHELTEPRSIHDAS